MTVFQTYTPSALSFLRAAYDDSGANLVRSVARGADDFYGVLRLTLALLVTQPYPL